MTAGPSYPADDADRSDLRLAGLDVPARATVALLVATALVLADYTGLVLRPPISLFGSVTDASLRTALERFVLFGIAPVAIVALAFRDRLTRYGLALGEWRWGLAFLVAGILVMTPIILAIARLPEFATYYGRAQPLADTLFRNAVELVPAEFLLRGFLLFALFRRIGPISMIVVQVPFVFAHVGKPELELWSTFVGGTVFAWLNWRTGSIVWSALGHLYVLTVMIAVAGGWGLS